MAIGSRRTTPTSPTIAAVVSEATLAPTKTPWVVGCCDRKSRVRMRRRAVRRFVFPTLPVVRRFTDVLSFPPGLVVRRAPHVREDRVVVDHVERVLVGLFVGTGHDAEVAGFRVDGAQDTILIEVQPGDIVTQRPDLPAGQRVRRYKHREIGLAACRREGAGDVVGLAVGTLDAHEQHMLGEPALGARLVAGDPERMALLAEQRVAAVAGAVALDGKFFREVHDESPLGIQFPGRVQPLHEGTLAFDPLERRVPHPGHYAHVDHHVRAVGYLHAAAGVGRVDRAHTIRNDVHRAAAHGTVEQRIHLDVRLVRTHPVVVGAGVLLLRRADERQVFHAGDVVGIREVQVAVGIAVIVQLGQGAVVDHLADEVVILGGIAAAPVDRFWLREFCDLVDPFLEGRKLCCHGIRAGSRGLRGRNYTGYEYDCSP
jgi:hypothetical protein